MGGLRQAAVRRSRARARISRPLHHRIAISNHRLLHVDDEAVTLRYKDYRARRSRSLTLPLAEFCRRFLLHVLPKGFVRIRHYGFLANGCRARLLSCCRGALAQPETGRSTTTQSEARTTNASSSFCPRAYASVPTVDAVRCGASKCSDDHLPAITDLVVSQPEGWPRPSAALVPVRACVDIGHPLSFSQCPTHSLPALRRPRPVQSPPPVPAAPTPGSSIPIAPPTA